MPVFGVWSEDVIFVASKSTTRKCRNLSTNPRCVITRDTGDLHLVVEGAARQVQDEPTLKRASQAFMSAYEWPTRVVGQELDADYGAPTSGGPPYLVWAITPTRAFSLPTDGETTTPTRWRFTG